MNGVAVTPEIVKHTYLALRGTRPFNRWGLPDARDLRFKVGSQKYTRGELEIQSKPLKITLLISAGAHSRLVTIAQTTAHEMVHLRLYYMGHRSWDGHGEAFQRLSRRVCDIHGFDYKDFI